MIGVIGHIDIVIGNYIPPEPISILSVPSKYGDDKVSQLSVKTPDTSALKSKVVDDVTEVNQRNERENDRLYIATASHLSNYSNKIVAHIPGFVAHNLSNSLHCEACIETLTLPDASDRPIHFNQYKK